MFYFIENLNLNRNGIIFRKIIKHPVFLISCRERSWSFKIILNKLFILIFHDKFILISSTENGIISGCSKLNLHFSDRVGNSSYLFDGSRSNFIRQSGESTFWTVKKIYAIHTLCTQVCIDVNGLSALIYLDGTLRTLKIINTFQAACAIGKFHAHKFIEGSSFIQAV